jgi:hypothetical protein
MPGLTATNTPKPEGIPMSTRNMLIFGITAAAIIAGTDFALAMKSKDRAGEAYSFTDHISARFGGAMDFMPGSKLAKALPGAPEGWTVRVGTNADSFVVMGQPIDATQLAAMDALEQKMIAAIPTMQMENRLYQNGDTAIYYGVNFLPANVKDSKAAYVVTQMFSMLDAQATGPINPDDGAFALKKFTAPEMGNAALYYTQIDAQLFISALSNAGDDATLALMAGLNKDALKTLVKEDPTIGQEAVAAEEEPEKADGCVQKGAAKFCSSTN